MLPRAWTGGLVSLIQVVAPLQDAAATAIDSAAGAVAADGNVVSAEAYTALAQQKAALEHRLAALTARADYLEEEVDVLTATRLWGTADRQIGARGRLIPARVVSSDMLPWRSSHLITAGSLQGVHRGNAVTSRLFTVEPGESREIQDGMAILLGEVLIGTIAQDLGTHTARVKLLSDVSVQQKVHIGALAEDEELVILDQYYWLKGRGQGVMEIRDVDRRNAQAGFIQVGDLVLSDSENPTLPAPMVIGRVVRIDPDRNNPLLCILTVESGVDLDAYRRVYVFAPDIAEAEPIPVASQP